MKITRNTSQVGSSFYKNKNIFQKGGGFIYECRTETTYLKLVKQELYGGKLMISKIINNSIKVSELKILSAGLIPSKAILRDITITYKADSNGKKTDEVEAIRYDVIDPDTFSTFTLKVANPKPVISKTELDMSENQIYIEIPVDEVNIKPYKIDYGKALLSITAPSIKLLKTS